MIKIARLRNVLTDSIISLDLFVEDDDEVLDFVYELMLELAQFK